MNLPGIYNIFNEKWNCQTIWLYSDPHFGDEELAAGIPERPSDLAQIQSINSKVGRKDLIIFLGDIGDVECVKKIRGRKILIAGNHDAGMSNYKDVFEEVYEGPLMIGEKLILSHEPINTPWAFNLHGHIHEKDYTNDDYHYNCCADHINYTPINFNQWLKEGHLKNIKSIHRATIDNATERKNRK